MKSVEITAEIRNQDWNQEILYILVAEMSSPLYPSYHETQ